MFGKHRDHKIKEWTTIIDRYVSLHKYIKEVGKIGITQARSGSISTEVQIKIKEALIQTDKSLNQLKNLFRSCLTDVDISDIFREEKFKLELNNLNKKIADLTQENLTLQKNVTENLDSNLHLENEHQLLLEDKKLLNEQVLRLEKHCKFLMEQIEKLVSNKASEENEEPISEDIIKISFLKKQEELEQTLKVQNDLIYNLKQQLACSIREKENFKSLNKDLKLELQKQDHFDYESKSDDAKEEEEEEDVNNQMTNDYSNRTTLRIDEQVSLRNENVNEERNSKNQDLLKTKISLRQDEELMMLFNDDPSQKENFVINLGTTNQAEQDHLKQDTTYESELQTTTAY